MFTAVDRMVSLPGARWVVAIYFPIHITCVGLVYWLVSLMKSAATLELLELQIMWGLG